MKSLRRLLVVSHVTHTYYNGRLYAYSPYVYEIDMWADLFPEVLIAAPCGNQPPWNDWSAFTRPNISILPQKELGRRMWWARAGQVVALPGILYSLCRAMRQADAIHVRSPGNLGLLGSLLGPLFSRYLVAKYAGQWNGYDGEPWSLRLQRSLLRGPWWRGPVTVYGRWPDQPAKIIPFFTSVMTAAQVERARVAARGRTLASPMRVLFVGRLSAAKNVDVLLSAIARLKGQGIRIQCTVVGDGPQRRALTELRSKLSLLDCVEFTGGLDFERVLDIYERSDVLVLVSDTEGWPKSVAEAMAFGLVCVGTNRGLVPEMLGEGRGFVVPPADVAALVTVLRRVAETPQAYPARSARAAEWGQRYSLEGLREALRNLLSEQWGAAVNASLKFTST